MTGIDVVHTVDELRQVVDRAARAGLRVGLVPTMGALHDGHASLVARAAADNDVVIATVFVNPLQFAPTEDLSAYPRTLAADVELCARHGATHVFAPSNDEMYPGPMYTTVSVAGVSERLEGASRPTHFAGVATVVAKLFALAGPCRAYFGEKDYQQLAVISTMAANLSFPVEVIGCATVRAADGLALSSRNAYLTDEQRHAAPVLYRALCAGRDVVAAGERSPAAVEAVLAEVIGHEPLAELDYVAVVRASDLARIDPLAGTLRLLVAARIGRARLIDNMGAEA